MKSALTGQKVSQQNAMSKTVSSVGPEGISFSSPNSPHLAVEEFGMESHTPTQTMERQSLSGQNGVQPTPVVQRLVINTGDASFPNEFKKTSGWIVASDVDLAFQEGGYGQRVEELNQVDTSQKVGKNENIYLEGHGSPGRLGHVLPDVVAVALNAIIPPKYTGKIRSHSCSAGVPTKARPSGVEALAGKLDVGGIHVQGAGGIALNHSVYAGTGGTRAFVEGSSGEKVIDDEIKNTRGPVDTAWNKYILSKGGQIRYADYPEAAQTATAVSETFYRDLEHNTKTHLLPKKNSLVESVSVGKPPQNSDSLCFITTACVQAKGLPDNCIELTTLRAFRDEYIMTLPNGKKMVKVYYENAPLIVEAIDAHTNALEIYNDLYKVIYCCVSAIHEGQYESAFQTYVDMVIKLRNRFTPLAAIPAFFYRVYQAGS